MRPRLALVPGEPAGIGPELCVRLAQRDHGADLVAIADPDNLLAAARTLGLPLSFCGPGESTRPGVLALERSPLAVPATFGAIEPANGPAVLVALLAAGRGCLEGRFHGLVTGPVHKFALNAAGIEYTGTTELLAKQAGVPVVMMLANTKLRVALVTTHLPLREVADAVDAPTLERTLRIVDRELRARFGLTRPRLAVLGLNPHAGEEGVLGREEIEVFAPVLAQLRSEGLDLRGPLPADTAFLPGKLAEVDAVIAMYHDQGLPVLKHAGFEQGVNITLGLPYPRVAVDHGTALNLAGRGVADPTSLIAAVALCAQLASEDHA
ncbi:MAG: 4-hydroxythreonine-4-phosphate dehydrogenase PdxA [Arenimonas sp.]